MALLGASRRSVRNFFFVSEEQDSRKCGTCDKVDKRNTGNTSNLRKHLQSNHPPQYKELLELEKQKEDEEKLLVKIEIQVQLSIWLLYSGMWIYRSLCLLAAWAVVDSMDSMGILLLSTAYQKVMSILY